MREKKGINSCYTPVTHSGGGKETSLDVRTDLEGKD